MTRSVVYGASVTLDAGGNKWTNLANGIAATDAATVGQLGGGGGIGSSSLIYRYTVTGADKASIDTGVDAPAAGSNDWTNGDLLEVFIVTRTDDAGATANVNITLNNDSGANYDNQSIEGDNGSALAGNALAANNWQLPTHGSGGTASVPGTIALTIPDFGGTTFFKQAVAVVARNDGTAANNTAQTRALNYRSTSAVTRLAVAATGAQKLKVGSQLLVYKRTAS